MTSYRLPDAGRINRGRPVNFKVDGRAFSGFEGDTLASALMANGVRLMGRSFKRHRPRGVLSAGPEEPNALFGLGQDGRFEPNTRATQTQLYDGLVAQSQNRWPSLEHDLFGLIDRAAPLLPAGFYYKTFKFPGFAWPAYEAVIRRLAGLGEPPGDPDPDGYEERFVHADLLVVGLGPAGLAAARAGAEAGLRVIAVEQDALPGGALLTRQTRVDGLDGATFASEQVEALRAAGVRVLLRATAFGLYDHNLAGVVQRCCEPGEPPRDGVAQRIFKVRARHIVIGAGAIERPLVFPGNDRPGAMLASAAACYAHRYGVATGRNMVVVTNNDDAYASAGALVEAGAHVQAIVDLRSASKIDPRALAIVEATGVIHHSGARAIEGLGGKTVTGVAFNTQVERHQLACDTLLMSGGWTPSVHLHAQSRGQLAHDAERGIILPVADARPIHSIGACAGASSTAQCWADGWRAGADVARALGQTPPSSAPIDVVEADAGDGVVPEWGPVGSGSKTAFVDFQNDVTLSDVELAVREGYVSVEHLKRYTTLGMGTDQGKTSSLSGLHQLANLRGEAPAQVGTTTYRPPYTPVTFSALAAEHTGSRLKPVRRSPVFAAHVEAGAVFQPSGLWLRPRYFPLTNETLHEAALREATTVRTRVGLTDASTFGKLEIVGPGAARFLDLVYATGVLKLATGRARYGLMLDDNGCILDDGTLWRLEAQRYFLTCSTVRADRVIAHLEFLRDTAGAALDFDMVDVSEALAAFAVAGPRSARVVNQVLGGLPPMKPQDVSVLEFDGRQIMLARISYSGEHAYEVYLPADAAVAMWSRLRDAVIREDGCVYGLEALEWLRIEKGHVAVGAEINGRTSAADLGMGGWTRKATPHAGSVGVSRPAFESARRLQLVGLTPSDGRTALPEGAMIVAPGADQTAIGHVTSSGHGVGVGRPVALALVEAGSSRMGEMLHAVSPCRKIRVPVQVSAPCAFDPKGERLAQQA